MTIHRLYDSDSHTFASIKNRAVSGKYSIVHTKVIVYSFMYGIHQILYREVTSVHAYMLKNRPYIVVRILFIVPFRYQDLAYSELEASK